MTYAAFAKQGAEPGGIGADSLPEQCQRSNDGLSQFTSRSSTSQPFGQVVWPVAIRTAEAPGKALRINNRPLSRGVPY
jgi:hypothetical protein